MVVSRVLTTFICALNAPSSIVFISVFFMIPIGPHSSYTTSFIGSSVYMSLKLNTAVLLVNYRGSTGYGQRSIDSLCGM